MIHPVNSPAGKIGIESIRAAVKVCHELEIPEIMVTSGFLCQIKSELDLDIFSQHLKIALEIAGEQDVGISFESALPADEILKMRSLLGSSFRICYDTFNPIRFHMVDKPEDDIRKLGLNIINHFHLKDGPENMIGCSLLGDGVGNFKEVANVINALGYQGWFITENYYANAPLCNQGDFDTVVSRDLEIMRNTFH